MKKKGRKSPRRIAPSRARPGKPADPACLELELFRAGFDSAPSGLIIVDGKGMIVQLNRQIETDFGYTQSELVGQSIEILVPLAYRNDHVTAREGYMQAPLKRSMGK